MQLNPRFLASAEAHKDLDKELVALDTMEITRRYYSEIRELHEKPESGTRLEL
ncbi:uncharacterized protein ARMOST_17665 [Armillaria ostoyae]|uniref:Uncharacterized protein n=1 Tax=Armillaria ostoyae TaxID=47428 RepID=A0A284RZQ0_ARMOS|nr:uncharacterized protein ARMOST_17665 [Armillaria ostoyae]